MSYLNTIPFIYGIEHAGKLQAELKLLPPNECSAAFARGDVDIALIPAAALPALEGAEHISQYCIGADGAVSSVVVVSDDPIEDVERIYLDPHSQTSVQLAGYLAKHHWNIAPEWLALDDYAKLKSPGDGEAFLLIGDKVFEHEGEFEYTYDLSEEWKSATSLPFAFAIWVAREGVDEDTIEALELSLTYGLEHIYEAILEYRPEESIVEAYSYLTESLDFLP
ncbi:MAG: MqnA/MqnD/SBP family protein, partial [Rikenellaceae bacterium]